MSSPEKKFVSPTLVALICHLQDFSRHPASKRVVLDFLTTYSVFPRNDIFDNFSLSSALQLKICPTAMSSLSPIIVGHSTSTVFENGGIGGIHLYVLL